ncbi:MAG: hypothetical protein IPO78_09885 [Saprospiraceae bacterium]|nr:hypothetical protein [Saprospiraceae bacterium]MBK8483706.1 hypothetical protein [Saprospiraceae bacterium]MBK9221158.1 hypothetical protein [Saprospiraceae bacterium]MBK9721908.1 hypothetical protein [Saprospiraceae bacterium]MBK9728969.1 hypothetical protein [Saprospiraceae bacterium]
MKIEIIETNSILDIQKSFSKKYPFLKMEFFTKPHPIHGGSRKEFIISNDTLIKNCRTKHNEGILEIYPHTIVAELEKNFNDIFGLSIQVFRKSGDVWIETTVTDDWTLEKQNTEAESFHNDLQERSKTDRNHLLS